MQSSAGVNPADYSPCPPRPLPAPLMVSEEGSFAHKTFTDRLPSIVQRLVAENSFPQLVDDNLRTLAAGLPDGLIEPLGDDGGPDVEDWVKYVEPYVGQRWLDLPWYFAEAYFYRRVLEATRYFTSGPTRGSDPYAAQKRVGRETTMDSVRALSPQVNELAGESDQELRPGFATLTQLALWGNRVDMSIWPADEEGEDRSRVEVEGEREYILVDDTSALLSKLAGLRGGRVDFIMDNAGFELVCDLCLVDYLLSSGVAAAVHLHLKPYPTFVSDAMVEDVHEMLAAMAADNDSEVRAQAERVRSYVEQGRLHLRDHLFWASPLVFWQVPDVVRRDLGGADLTFVKGDANYRRLLGDRHWAFTHPFQEIVCYFPSSFVALRTLKSEVVAGLDAGQPEKVEARDPNWLTAGRWGVIQHAN
jgi:hypothetical protein